MIDLNSKQIYYAVKKGHQVGIFDTWDEIKPLVDQYPGASYKKFTSRADAEKFMQGGQSEPPSGLLNMFQYIKKKNLEEDTTVNKLVQPKKNQLVTIKQLVKVNTTKNSDINCLPDSTICNKNESPFITDKVENTIIRNNVENIIIRNKAKNAIVFDKVENPIVYDKAENPLVCDNFQKIAIRTKPIQKINVYCDGSALNNGKKYACGGIGIWFGHEDEKNVSEPFTLEIPTNQKTEIYALTRTLDILSRMIETNKTTQYEFSIYSDSQYTIDCLTKWMPGWKKNNWVTSKGEAVKNRQLLENLYEAYYRHRRHYAIHHVRSHRPGGPQGEHEVGNAHADQLAVNGSHQHPNYKRKTPTH